jgi:hypothetical protein
LWGLVEGVIGGVRVTRTDCDQGRWRKWWVIALGVLVVLGVIGAVAGGGNEDDDDGDAVATIASTTDDESGPPVTTVTVTAPSEADDSTAPPTTPETPTTTVVVASTVPENGTSLAAPAPVGEAVQVGDWTIRVVTVTPDAGAEIAAANEFNEPPIAGNQFFMATLEATYTGSESSTFWVDMTLKAIGDSSVAYEGFASSCGVIPNEISNAGETFPGGTITGNVCWSIESGDAASLTMLADASFSFDSDSRVAFSLT